MSHSVELTNVGMTFGATRAVGDVSFAVEAGEFFSILGPSGCGKTTILRMIAGFLQPTEGRIAIGGRDMSGLGPNQRPTAMIFQSLALFPLMPVWENIAFGLEARGASKAERRAKADDLLKLIALEGFGDRMPGELSGGQRQRVAIARALAVEPQVLLLDEPLSALDLKLRQHMRAELRALQKRTGVTFIYITHDQGEALTMSDSIAVMRAGVIDQIGDGKTIYNDPATPFAASFVGENNVFRGKVKQVSGDRVLVQSNRSGELLARVSTANVGKMKEGDSAMIFIRPEAFELARTGTEGDHYVSARVVNEEFEGNVFNIFMEGDGGKEIKVSLPNVGQSFDSHKGETMTLRYDVRNAVAMPAGVLATE